MTRKHVIAAVILAAVMTLAAFMAFADTTMYVRTNGGHLNVRREPDMDAEIITRLSYGQEVNVVNFLNGWAEISMRYQGGLLNGYVSTNYLSSTRPGGGGGSDGGDSGDVAYELNRQFSTMRQVSSFQILVRPSRAGGFVNLRWAPNTNIQVIERCYSDYRLNVLAESSQWYQVQDPINGMIGFIMKSYTTYAY